MGRTLSMAMPAAIAASCVTTRRKPSEAECEDFRRRCSEADLLLLGHMAFEARDQVLRDIAEAEVRKRLGGEKLCGKAVHGVVIDELGEDLPRPDAGMVAGRYGKCPQCSAPVTIRERRPNGDDRCANGHVFPSATTVRG